MSKRLAKITILVDNEAREGLEKEHGFSAWIEAGNRRILFDTGHMGALQENVKRLNVDLSEADTLVISHGHRDHTGTLDKFLKINNQAKIYFSKEIDQERWWYKPDADNYGMPEEAKKMFRALPSSRLYSLNTYYYLDASIGITGPVPRLNDFEDTGGSFYLDNRRDNVDKIEDDQSIWFETEKGLVVLLGCCHSGLSNTIEYVRKVSGVQKVHGVVGGMHLLQANEERLEKTFNVMRDWNADFLIPCHCTGVESAQKMEDALGSKIVCRGYGGLEIEVGVLQ